MHDFSQWWYLLFYNLSYCTQIQIVTGENNITLHFLHMQLQSGKHNSTTNTCSDNIHTYKEYRISVLKNKATNHLMYMVAWHAQHVKSHLLLQRKQTERDYQSS